MILQSEGPGGRLPKSSSRLPEGRKRAGTKTEPEAASSAGTAAASCGRTAPAAYAAREGDSHSVSTLGQHDG